MYSKIPKINSENLVVKHRHICGLYFFFILIKVLREYNIVYKHAHMYLDNKKCWVGNPEICRG